jgi:hypothetical protein
MFGRLTFFLIGAAAGIFAKDSLRGAAKGVIGGAIKAQASLKALAVEAVEDLQDEKAAAAKGGPVRTN